MRVLIRRSPFLKLERGLVRSEVELNGLPQDNGLHGHSDGSRSRSPGRGWLNRGNVTNNMNPLADIRLIHAETPKKKIHVYRGLDQCGFGKCMAKGQGGRGRGIRLDAVHVLGAIGHKNGSCLPSKESDLVAYLKARELGQQTSLRRRRAARHGRHVFLDPSSGPLCVARLAGGQSSSTSVGANVLSQVPSPWVMGWRVGSRGQPDGKSA